MAVEPKRSTGWQGCTMLSPAIGLSLLLFAAGCGGNVSSGGGGGPISGDSTEVTVLATSTANDQVTSFPLFLNSLTLTSKSGKTVTVLSSPQQVEFIHLNGAAEPLATVSVPQDYYTSATVVVGAESFTCLGRDSQGGVLISTFGYGYTPSSLVTVSVPQQITVSGTAMGLLLNLNASDSANAGECFDTGVINAITPNFEVTGFQLTSNPTSPATGNFSHLSGIVSSVDAATGALTVAGVDGLGWENEYPQGNTVNSSNLAWNVSTDASTTFQGVAGPGALVAGTAVDLDATLQANGVLSASRLAVLDPDPNDDLTLQYGPLMQIPPPTLTAAAMQYDVIEQGYLYTAHGTSIDYLPFGYQNAVFQTAGGYSNLGNLPFTPNFSAATMVAGQDVLITSHATSFGTMAAPAQAATYTLMPQTIDGTVSAVGTSGNFTVYTVTLAPYDLFPTMAFTSEYETSPLTSPDTVYVYADSSTSMLNTQPAAAGSTVRFTGLVFNDNGTLRMDCSQMMDGVAE
jgi:hypothetical protein